jgi:hypothetical protein
MREALKEQMPIEYSNVEWALFPKTIYYTRSSDGLKMSTTGVSLQVTNQAAGQVDTMLEDIANMWQKVSTHRGGLLLEKHIVSFGKSGDMGYNITTQIIHRHNAMLKSTNQRVLTNLNEINTFIEMDTPDTANFGHNGMFTLREAFLSYKDSSGEPILSGIEARKQVVRTVSFSMKKTLKLWTKFLLTLMKNLMQLATGTMRQFTIDTSHWMTWTLQVKIVRHKGNRSGRNITS